AITSPYSIAWNTTAAANGQHTLTAVARDMSGNTATATAVSVTVNNPVDAAPPTVSMTAPANGATVSGSNVTVSATAADDVGVVHRRKPALLDHVDHVLDGERERAVAGVHRSRRREPGQHGDEHQRRRPHVGVGRADEYPARHGGNLARIRTRAADQRDSDRE